MNATETTTRGASKLRTRTAVELRLLRYAVRTLRREWVRAIRTVRRAYTPEADQRAARVSMEYVQAVQELSLARLNALQYHRQVVGGVR